MLATVGFFVACALLACRTVLAIPTIEIKGSKFFTSDGNQFFIKGVAYSVVSDQNGLVNGDQCAIDAKLISALGANVVRAYTVDPTLDHSKCMQAFADVGIYVLVDMSTPTYAINRADPKWTLDLRNAFAQVIDGFHGYDNLLGFFAGNEIVNDQSTSKAAPYAKAVVADMKAYRDLMQYRKIPIGYSAADVAGVRTFQQDYFDCGDNETAVDFYGFNYYAWCGDSSMAESGYDQIYSDANGYDVPIFLSETGCKNGTSGRIFSDQVAMLGREMNDRFSGNIVYEWTEESSGYGLVSYAKSSATPSLLGDYTRLKSQWATLNPTGVKASAYNPTLTKRECPAFTSSKWLVQKSATLPTLGLSGFTAPTSTASSGGTTAGSGTHTVGSGPASATSDSKNSKKSSKSPVGAIAGGVLGGLVVLAILLGGVLFILHRKRKQRASLEGASGGSESQGAESDKMVVDDEEKMRTNGFYGPNYHELSGQGATPELDPARGQVAPMPAPEMGHGTDGERRNVPTSPTAQPLPSHPTEATQTSQSPYVEAQRRIEVEWLETEEARLRQRREVLMQQNGGSNR